MNEMPYHMRPEVKKRRKTTYKIWSLKNKDHLARREAKRRLEKRGQCLIANCRTRARKRGIKYDLDGEVAEIQRRIDVGRCEITGVPFDLSPGKKWNSPSIDRIDPIMGYVPGNVRVVCQAMNVAMGDWGEGPVWEMFQSWLAMQSRPRSRKSL